MSLTEEALKQIRSRLDEKIPRDVVKQREGGGGRSFSYLEGHYVIARLNEIFGNGGWSYTTKHLEKAHTGMVKDKYNNEVHTAHYIAMVELVVPGLNAVYGDVGYGDGSDKQNPGKAHELAAKEAVTDALKRCAKNLGMSMGLALYDKTQENVSDGDGTSSSDKSRTGTRNSRRPAADKPASVASTDGERSAPAEPAAAAPEGEKVYELIQSTARVAIAKRKTTKDDLSAYLKEKYGVEQSKALKPAQAQEFLGHLNTMI